MANDQYSILWRGRDPNQGFEVNRSKAKVTRYYAGQAPTWAKEAEEEEEEEQRILIKDDHAQRRLNRLRGDAESRDDRLQRRERAAVVIEPKRNRGEAEVVVPGRDKAEVVKEEEEEDSDLEEKRQRAKLLAKARDDGDGIWAIEDDEEDREGDESEYETDSEEEDAGRALAKPVFVGKSHRETEKEKIRMDEEKKENERKEKERKATIQEESKKMLFDMVRKDEEVKDEQKSDEEDLPDDADGKNEAEEYELWRIRELKRHRRDKAEREKRALEKADVERRRNMTDEERKKEDERLAKKDPKRDKTKKFEFMQKYFHRGAYFQDKAVDGSEPLYLRDFHDGTAADKVDKSALPKVMQLRRGLWGMKGQVKHTHLSAEDTTSKESLVGQMDQKLADKLYNKMAGVKAKDVLDRPTPRGI